MLYVDYWILKLSHIFLGENQSVGIVSLEVKPMLLRRYSLETNLTLRITLFYFIFVLMLNFLCFLMNFLLVYLVVYSSCFSWVTGLLWWQVYVYISVGHAKDFSRFIWHTARFAISACHYAESICFARKWCFSLWCIAGSI